MYVVLVYDVSQQENGSKRWLRIFKICKKYLTHIQNSVFEGELSKAQLAKLQQELKLYILSPDRKSGLTRNFGDVKTMQPVLSYDC